MNKKFIKINIIALLALIFLAIAGCTKTEIEFPENEFEEKVKLMKEVTLLTGNVLTNSDIQKGLVEAINEVGHYDNTLTFAFLFGIDDKIQIPEQKYLNKKREFDRKNLTSLASAFQKEYIKNTEKYMSISANLERRNGSKSNGLKEGLPDNFEDLATLFADEGLKIYFPLAENGSQDNMDVIYLTYDPLVFVENHYGFRFETGVDGYENVDLIDEEFIETEPTFIVSALEPWEYPNSGYEVYYLERTYVCPITGDLNPYGYDDFDILPPGDGGPIGGINPPLPPPPPPPPPTITCPQEFEYMQVTPMVCNVNHYLMPTNDIVEARISKIRLNSRKWLRWLASSQKFSIYRASADGAIQYVNGQIVPSANSYDVLKNAVIPKKDIGTGGNKGKWFNYNAEFDPSWRYSEHTQNLAFFTHHTFAGSEEVTLTPKVGIKGDSDNNFQWFYEVSVSASIKISLNAAVFRSKIEMPRESYLANITGLGFSGVSVLDNGVNYNVKQIDNGTVEFYMKYQYQNLTPDD